MLRWRRCQAVVGVLNTPKRERPARCVIIRVCLSIGLRGKGKDLREWVAKWGVSVKWPSPVKTMKTFGASGLIDNKCYRRVRFMDLSRLVGLEYKVSKKPYIFVCEFYYFLRENVSQNGLPCKRIIKRKQGAFVSSRKSHGNFAGRGTSQWRGGPRSVFVEVF